MNSITTGIEKKGKTLISDLLPKGAKETVYERKNSGWTIEVFIDPSLSENEYDRLKNKIIDIYKHILLEVFTRTTGRHFFVYLRGRMLLIEKNN